MILTFLILFQAAFDWPLGQIGKIKQKYQKSKPPATASTGSASRSKSDANIADIRHRNLKRRSSERQKSRKVAFEDQQSVPWWNYPMKFMKNATSSSNTSTKKKRRRHSTDPESSKDQQHIQPLFLLLSNRASRSFLLLNQFVAIAFGIGHD